MILKEPGVGGAWEWHQDFGYWYAQGLHDPDGVVSAIVALDRNTLANGAVQLNATAFYYDYEGYQITQIVNRSSANFNIDAKLKGLEFETIWNPASTFVMLSILSS